MGESGCGSEESASRSSGTSSFGSVYLWGKEEGPARRGEHMHASASRARSKLGPFVHDAVRELAEEGVGRVVWDEHLPDATRDQMRSDEIR